MKANTENNDVALVSCMRNEGLFVLEWLAYHSLLGFKKIVVFTNDCTDGSDTLLDRLQERQYLTHIRHSVPNGRSVQKRAMAKALCHEDVKQCEWLLHIDSDEYLNVSAGQGTVHDLISAVGEADLIAIAWKWFGCSGNEFWSGGSTMCKLVRGQASPQWRLRGHKSLFRQRKFGRASDHMPKNPTGSSVLVKSTNGTVLDDRPIYEASGSKFSLARGDLTFENATINHYAFRSIDTHLMKNDRGDGMGFRSEKYYYRSKFWNKFNVVEALDHSILRWWPEVQNRLSEFLADPETRRLNDACLAAYIERRDKVLTPEQIAAWTASPDESEDTTP